MKGLIAALCCMMLVASPLALAQGAGDGGKPSARKEPTAKQLAHQQKLKNCSKQAGERQLKGEARKTFMRDCLKG